jgi:hypothetical protein
VVTGTAKFTEDSGSNPILDGTGGTGTVTFKTDAKLTAAGTVDIDTSFPEVDTDYNSDLGGWDSIDYTFLADATFTWNSSKWETSAFD